MPTYFVDPVSGSNGNAGTSFAAAWATVQYALDNCAAGDEIRLCNTGTESISASVDIDAVDGDVNNFISLISYNSTGTAEEHGYTIQASATISTGMFRQTTNFDYYHWRGITFDGNSNADTGFAINSASTDDADYAGWCSCTFKNMTASGATIGGTSPNYFMSCVFEDNGVHGLTAHGASRGKFRAYGCIFRNNTNTGCVCRYLGESYLHNCLAYGNGDDGCQVLNGAQITRWVGNTFADNTRHGLFMNDANQFCAASLNHFVGNGGFGLKQGAANQFVHIHDNNFYGNTSGDSDQSMRGRNFAVDPAFDSEYRPTVQIESDLGFLIGAKQMAASGGGALRQMGRGIHPQFTQVRAL